MPKILAPIAPDPAAMKKPLSKLERVPLREAWMHEANDFYARLERI